MSLQVWLPLNGSLENLGFSDTSQISTTNLSFSDNGKIGKCVNGYTGYFNIPSMTGKKQLSVAYWIRINTATSTQWLDAFRWYSTDGSATYVSRNEFYNNSTRTGVWYKNGSLGDAGLTYVVGTWCHHAFTIDYETGEGKFYIDGVLKYTASTVDTTHYLTGTNFMIGENGLDTSHNDVRIYDHILSAKEVKELSKGLVAHYPLNDFIGNPNLIQNGYGNTKGTTWIAEGCTLTVEDDCFKIASTSTNKRIYDNVSNVWNSGEVYIVSFLARSDTNGAVINVSRSIANFSPNFTLSTEWKKYSGIITSTETSAAGTLSIRLVTASTVYLKLIKLEKGSVATPWIPNVQDDLYSAMGLNEAIVYDCSGYGHNGTLSPTPPVVATDTARYSSCIKFNGSNNYIDLDIDTWLPTDAVTVSVWAYMDTWGSSRFISCTEGGGWNFEAGEGGGWRFPVYKNGIGYCYAVPVKKWADYTSGWHHIVGTFDGYVSRIYIDGELDSVSTNATPGTKTLIKYNQNAKLFIGCEANTASPIAPYFPGKISDVRIYCTALSADDIKALYETSVSIDDKGNFHAYEISEV